MANILTFTIPRDMVYVFAIRGTLLGFRERPQPMKLEGIEDDLPGVFTNSILLCERFPYAEFPGFMLVSKSQLRNPPTAKEFVEYFDNVGWYDG